MIAIENHSDYTWRISFRPVGSTREPEWLAIAPREKRDVPLDGGRYRVGRVLVSDAAGSNAVEAELTLAGGHTYVWPLGTLFSDEIVAP
jgi:hypothetical protein